MRINNNLMALNAHRFMTQANSKQSKSLEKLSSGLAINSAADNAAGLAISEKMRAQINGLDQAVSNAQDGISMIQTAEGALQETQNILQRMRELAVQSSNDTNTEGDRAEIQNEIDQLAQEITRISESTEFNTKTLLDGSLADQKLHIGANKDQDISVSIGAMDAVTLSVATLEGEGDDAVVKGIDVSTQDNANSAIETLNTAINTVSQERSKLGAIQNRLEHTITNLSTTAENMTASESRIRDVDMAKEMMEYTKLGILQQASQAMLAQANVAPQGVLQLLQ